MGELSLNLIATGTINVTMLFILIYLIFTNPVITKKRTAIYAVAIILTIICTVAEIASYILEPLGSAFRTLSIVVDIIGFSASPCICVALSVLFNYRLYSKLKYICIPLAANFLLFLSSVRTGWMFSVSSENVYSRGPLYNLYILVYIYSFFILMLCNYHQSQEFAKKEKYFLTLLYIILIAGTTVQVIFPNIHTSWPSVTLVLIMYYIFQRELQFRYDTVTRTLNRCVFEKTIKSLKASDNAYIVIFDIDKFKHINDSFGHAAGDKYLQQAAANIKSSFKDIGDCYRIGGDEFCVIAMHSDESTVLEGIDRMKNKISCDREKDLIMPSISYGYSTCSDKNVFNSLELFYKADREMYKNKRNIQLKF